MAEGELKKIYLPLARQHVTRGHDWGFRAGTDFWLMLNPGIDQGIADSDTDPGAQLGLAAHGWTATSLVNTVGSTADFMSGADKGTPHHFLTDASGDLLESPAIFGDYAHAWMASRIAGMLDLPRFLIAEFLGAMTVATADEPRSGWGFIEDGGSVATEADQAAFISTDGTNFQISANAGTPVNGDADDATWHLFKLVMDRVANVSYWYMTTTTGVALSRQGGTSATVAITADEAPYSFGFHALTTNRPALGLTHVYYDWGTLGGS